MLTRRNFLAVAAATAGLFVVGCTGEKDEAPTAAPATEPAEDAPAADTAAAGNVLGDGKHGGRGHRGRRAPGCGRFCH